MLSAAKTRANKNGIPFNISIEDIIIPEYCPILNIRLVFNKGRVDSNSPTLDRLIPELGYTKGNIRVISHRANLMKSHITKDIWERIGVYMGWHLT